MVRRQGAVIAGLALVVCAAALRLSPGLHVAADALPKRFSDQAFRQMIDGFSEPGGFFRSDNLISNESTFQHVVPELQRRPGPGGVYVGVGPDQNFTYIVALRPKVAFIIDIRRQNMLLHLMYKGIIEQSSDRADFLSRLFSRERPVGLSPASTPKQLFDAYLAAPEASELKRKENFHAFVDYLVKHHGFRLSPEDLHSLDYVYDSFCAAGPDLRYSFPRGFGGRWFPSYAELMMETDEDGRNHSYMATEENFRVLKDMERNNLIVPIVGDFGGDKAIKAVGQYLKEHGAAVTVFYTSNVEQYLFQSDAWRRFFMNVAALPIDDSSTFIRAYFNNAGFRYKPPGPGGLRSATLLDPIGPTLAAFRDGKIQSYYDVVERSK